MECNETRGFIPETSIKFNQPFLFINYEIYSKSGDFDNRCKCFFLKEFQCSRNVKEKAS